MNVKKKANNRVMGLIISMIAGLLAAAVQFIPNISNSSAQGTNLFTLYGSEPIVTHGEFGQWDGTFTDPGAVMYHEGKFHMFRNGFKAWPATVQVGYVTSTDGYSWVKQDSEPVFTTAQVPYAGVAALASSVVVRDDGTWIMYFYTWEKSFQPFTGAIGRATAPGPNGPWTPDSTPVLKPGSGNAWDSGQVAAPSVLRTENGYVMYYTGSRTLADRMIGMATSPDGIIWTKYNDPSTNNPDYAESDPVLGPGAAGAWDNSNVHQPGVQRTPDGWVMLYRSAGGRDQNMALGYATSTDGIHWLRYANNPVLRPSAVASSQGFWYTNMVYHNNTYFITWEVGRNQTTDIFLATYTGSLPAGSVAVPIPVPATEPTATPGNTAPTITPTPSVDSTPAAVPGSNNRTFPETGKTVNGLFLDYWDNNGGLAQQGFPISEVLTEVSDLDGKAYTVQYFERAVFEYHPEEQAPYNVLLSQLGTFRYKELYPNDAPDQKVNNEAGSQLFPETGHSVGGKFLDYWKTHGGLAQQGFPISDEFSETNQLDGKVYTVQYFERAVFEMHPENPAPYDVLLSQLGTFRYESGR